MGIESGKIEPIKEYLFVDSLRTAMYLEQIKSSTHTIIPTLKRDSFILDSVTGELNLIIGKIAVNVRRLLRNDKICVDKLSNIEDYLKKANQLDFERSLWDNEIGKRFCLEECIARKILFPNAKSMIPGIKGLAIWISPEQQTRDGFIGPLYLIEYYLYDEIDRSPISPLNDMSGMSGYTAYRYLLDGLDTDSRKLLNECLTEEAKIDPEASFVKDPVKCWRSAQVTIGDMRKIRCLYRRRAALYENNGNILSTFGYPIYISEA